MLRTLIFGAIAGIVGKKLYDEGKLSQFKEDLVDRLNRTGLTPDPAAPRTASATSPSSTVTARPAGTVAGS